MLFIAILIFVVELICCIVVPITSSTSHTAAIIGIIISIALTAASVAGIFTNIRNIKIANQRGKSIAALVFSASNTITGFTLFIISLIFLNAPIITTLY